MALPKRKKNFKKPIKYDKIPKRRFWSWREPERRFTRSTINDLKSERALRGIVPTNYVGEMELFLQDEERSLLNMLRDDKPNKVHLPLELIRRPHKEYVLGYREMRKKIFKKRRLLSRRWYRKTRWELRDIRVNLHKVRKAFAQYSKEYGKESVYSLILKKKSRFGSKWEASRSWKLSKINPMTPGWEARIGEGSAYKTLPTAKSLLPGWARSRVVKCLEDPRKKDPNYKGVDHNIFKKRCSNFYTSKSIKVNQKRHWYYVSPQKRRNPRVSTKIKIW